MMVVIVVQIGVEDKTRPFVAPMKRQLMSEQLKIGVIAVHMLLHEHAAASERMAYIGLHRLDGGQRCETRDGEAADRDVICLITRSRHASVPRLFTADMRVGSYKFMSIVLRNIQKKMHQIRERGQLEISPNWCVRGSGFSMSERAVRIGIQADRRLTVLSRRQ